MSRLVEDLLCGIVGYGLGKRNRKVTDEQAEDVITHYLRDIPLEKVISRWVGANGYDGGCEGPVIDRLRAKADEMERRNS